MDGLKFIVRNQGWQKLFAGLSINYIKVTACSVWIKSSYFDWIQICMCVISQDKLCIIRTIETSQAIAIERECKSVAILMISMLVWCFDLFVLPNKRVFVLCSQIVPSVAIGFTAYDAMKVWLHITPQQKSQRITAA